MFDEARTGAWARALHLAERERNGMFPLHLAEPGFEGATMEVFQTMIGAMFAARPAPHSPTKGL